MDDQTLAREVRALYAISSALNAGTNEQTVLDTFLERTVTELGYTAATLRLLDEEQQTLELRAAYGLSQAYLRKGPVAIGQSKIDQAVLAGQSVVVEDVQQDASFHYAAAAAHEGLASTMIIPVRADERTIGVLRVYTGSHYRFSTQERALLSAIANLGAQGIRRAQRATAYQTMAHALTASLDRTVILTELLRHSIREVQVKAGSIRLLGPRQLTLHLAAAAGLSAAYLAKGAVDVAHSPIDQHVIARGQPLAMTEITQAIGLHYPEEAQREGIRSILVVPLRVREHVIGVLRLYSGQTRHFGEDAITFAATVADLGALALENARLHAALKTRLDAAKEDSNAWYRYLALS